MKYPVDSSQPPGLSGAGYVAGLCAIFLLCLGCAQQQPLRPSGFLDRYEELRFDKMSGIYSFDATTQQIAKTHIILLHNVQWWAVADVDPEWRRELCEVLKERLRFWVLQEVQGRVIVLDDEKNLDAYLDLPGVRVFTIDMAITRVDKGFGLGRYLIGLGLGNAKLSLEVRATRSDAEAESIHQAVVFGSSHGNPHGGLNPRSISGLYSLRLAGDSAAKQVARFLACRILFPEPEWWKRTNP